MSMTFEEFTAKFGLRLNAQQRAAVLGTQGPILLLAVPGSGKTTVIVARIAYMLYCLGIKPGNILTMTYTVAATNEMRARFAAKYGAEYADKLEFCTINALCARIINRYGATRGREVFTLVEGEAGDGSDGRIAEIYASLYGRPPSEGDVREIKTYIAYCKNMQLRASEIEAIKIEGAAFSEIYAAYRSTLTGDRLMDYDDQLRYALTILRKCPDILAELHGKYHYINVDEAQDTSKIQHSVIAMLAAGRRNLFMVGDEDQSIYGFRAAYPRALLDFDRTYAPATTLLMEQNYRSTGEIVMRANRFIAQNKDRYDKRMVTANRWGAPMRRTVVSDLTLQYHYLAEVASESAREVAVLYRNNDSAIPVIDALDKIGVKYSGGPSDTTFFSNYIIKDIVNIIRFALEPDELRLFLSVYRQLDLRLRQDAVERLRERHANRRGRQVLKTLLADKQLGQTTAERVADLRDALGDVRHARGSDIVTAAIESTGYGRYLKSGRAGSPRVTVLKVLAEQNPSAAALLRRLDELRELIGSDAAGAANPVGGRFFLSTIHSAKGLEFEHVIMIDAIQGILPSVRMKDDREPSPSELAALEEERRMFYVGVTRAKDQLEVITYEREFGARTDRSFPFVDALTGDGPALMA